MENEIEDKTEKRMGFEKWMLMADLFSSLVSENTTMVSLTKFTDGDVHVDVYGVTATKDELEDKYGLPLKSQYIGDGVIRFAHVEDGLTVRFSDAGVCKKIGTKKKVITKEVVVTPAVVKKVEEEVTVSVYECSKGKKFEG